MRHAAHPLHRPGIPAGRTAALGLALSLAMALVPALAFPAPAPPVRHTNGAAARADRPAVTPARAAAPRAPLGGAAVAPEGRPEAVGQPPYTSILLGVPQGPPASPAWWLAGLFPVLLLPFWVWAWRTPRHVNRVHRPGFEVITPSERRRFIPLEEKYQHLDFLHDVKLDTPLRLSANLNKVSLSIRRFGYQLEDKNFRNALLVNRRRMRRTLLRDGDVLDLGDLTLLYRDHRAEPAGRYTSVTPQEGRTLIRFRRARGPIRKGTPVLISEQYPNRVFYMTKNMVFIGRSEANDLIVKSQNIHYRHAKIERVGGRYKLLDLGNTGNTYVNNRRAEQRFLREGDVITLDKQRFRFSFASKLLRERPGQAGGYGPGAEEDSAYGAEDEASAG